MEPDGTEAFEIPERWVLTSGRFARSRQRPERRAGGTGPREPRGRHRPSPRKDDAEPHSEPIDGEAAAEEAARPVSVASGWQPARSVIRVLAIALPAAGAAIAYLSYVR